MIREAVNITNEYFRTKNKKLVSEGNMMKYYNEWLDILHSKIGILPALAIYNNLYTMLDEKRGIYGERICLFLADGDFIVNFCAGENDFYIITHNGEDTRENIIRADDLLYANIDKIKDVFRFKRQVFYPYKHIIESMLADSYTVDNSPFFGAYYSIVESRLEKMQKRSWVNKHRLSKFIDNKNFVLRPLTEDDLSQVRNIHNIWAVEKKDNYSYELFYEMSMKDPLNIYNDAVGLFYKDLLLSYRLSHTLESGYSYAYVENCVSGLEKDTEFMNSVRKYISTNLCLDYCSEILSKSNVIGEEILKLKSEGKFKKAKSIALNKDFIGSLEQPIPDSDSIKLLYKEKLDDFISVTPGFTNVRVKHLFLYKLMEYYKKEGVSVVSVSSGVFDALINYKIATNTGRTNIFSFDCKIRRK